jgi:hypothetical protein
MVLAETGAGDQTIMDIAGHVSQRGEIRISQIVPDSAREQQRRHGGNSKLGRVSGFRSGIGIGLAGHIGRLVD